MNVSVLETPTGLVLGRKGLAKKQSTIDSDKCRLGAHVRPLIGHVRAAEIVRADIETLKRDVALGKTAKDRMLGPRRRSIVRGGKGVVTRLLGTLGAVFGWGQENGYVEHNPVRGVKRFADQQKKARSRRSSTIGSPRRSTGSTPGSIVTASGCIARWGWRRSASSR